jgi:hypothetical protein
LNLTPADLAHSWGVLKDFGTCPRRRRSSC